LERWSLMIESCLPASTALSSWGFPGFRLTHVFLLGTNRRTSSCQRSIKTDPNLRWCKGIADWSLFHPWAENPRCPGGVQPCRDWPCLVRRVRCINTHTLSITNTYDGERTKETRG
jgi:hypothetical protein